MTDVVAPVFQAYDVPPAAVNVADEPAHTDPSLEMPDVSVTAMEPVGSVFTVTVEVAVAVQPMLFVTVTVYVVVEPGVSVIAAVVVPVFHIYETPPEPVNVADAPVQILPSLFVVPDVSATVIPEDGGGGTVMVVVAVPVHPVTSVAVTVYVVVALGDTMIDAAVAPVLHE